MYIYILRPGGGRGKKGSIRLSVPVEKNITGPRSPFSSTWNRAEDVLYCTVRGGMVWLVERSVYCVLCTIYCVLCTVHCLYVVYLCMNDRIG